MNFKPTIFASIIAFVLSFFVALISGAGFGISLLRAFISAICFGALTVGISFLYNKFLDDGSTDSTPSDTPSESNPAPIGNKVDIVINDEELQDDENSPKFVLTGQNQMLNKGDVEEKSNQGFTSSTNQFTKNEFENVSPLEPEDEPKSQPQTQTQPAAASRPAAESLSNISEEPSFKPVPLVKPSSAGSSQLSEEFPPIEDTLGANSILNDNKSSAAEENVDVLPDMGISDVGRNDDTVTDSDFATAGKAPSRLNETVFPDGAKADSKDSTLMAEAIRTILRKEE